VTSRAGSLPYDLVLRFTLRSTTKLLLVLRAVSGGRIGRHFPGGGAVVWLTLPGRRTGQPRTTPLLSTPEDDGPEAAWVVAGSNAGQSQAPAWVLNARAAGRGEVEVEGRRVAVAVVEVTEPSERAEAYARLVSVWRFFAGYARRTRAVREIPVFRLTPLPEARDAAEPPPSRWV
jgi:deazaflavin-dependent oxidoreductase (nitroreductase family)